MVLKNSGKWNREHLLDLVLFLHVLPDVLNFFQQTWHSQLYRCDYTCRILFFLKYLPHIWKLFGFNAGWHIFSYIYQSAVSCLGNEAQEIRKHIQKSTYSTNCSWFHFTEFLRARVSKGILSHSKVDWPCQDFTQGSTREQPTAH